MADEFDLGGVDGLSAYVMRATPTWGPWNQMRYVPGPSTRISLAWTDVLQAVLLISGNLQRVVCGNDAWRPDPQDINGEVGNDPGDMTDGSCAGVTGALHVVGLINGKPLHTIRNPDGTWQGYWGDVNSAVGSNPGPFTAIASAGVGTALHVVGLVNGAMKHTIRNSDGSWQKSWGDVNSAVGSAPGAFGTVACAAVGSDLHVLGLSTGKPFHAVRYATTKWQSGWGDVYAAVGKSPPSATQLASCAPGSSGRLHVFVTTDPGYPFHTIRNADGSWQKYWDNIIQTFPSTPTLTAMGATGGG